MDAKNTGTAWYWDDNPVGEIDYNLRAPWLLDERDNAVISGELSVRCDADARLIAASPELLEALERLSDQCDRLRLPGQPLTDAEKTARSVIAKAKGAA